ncbi:dnaJ homolog subfamily C member 10-like [Physella acuta]|uniref:dnaJ homolog subfamily C member 10-like n=1 Tax=Physella acuta TaxID=109671 RepID=UPI0027DC7A37|nr:dnaJ homolog subfamily C member 10-like [Physella acuta]
MEPTTALRCLVFIYLFIIQIVNGGEDYYTLLGVSKGASAKEIRRAFKQLAISKHPDKNVDDPKAHDVFVKINRAYEVLKDEDLRKKYDQYGEEGLKDDFQRGRQYESWQWYQQNFGIYDDDPEIITLSRVDFEQSVEGTGEAWFINFYSPHCSHCHDLAPTWREVARELEGVIRIGAVNCEDDWQLCRMQNVHSYPSLYFYPDKEKFHGQRTTDVLVQEALQRVNAKFYTLRSSNFQTLVGTQSNGLPWLITFCGDGGDCLEEKTCIKLAAMLSDLVNIGKVDCDSSEDLCAKLGQEHGTVYYKSQRFDKQSGMVIASLYPKDIARTVLQELPDVELISQDALHEINTKREETWLIHFVDGLGNPDLELRKLPTLVKNYKVGRADCSTIRLACQKLHVTKFPTFMLFKSTGGTERYYGGRITAHDIAAFVHDSADTPLENLSPEDFPDRVVNSKEPWFVDFFAPWCPPCMRLLPEFKKTSKAYKSVVNFGTVDCTVHGGLCNTYNIRSYPTTILYNQSVPHQYHGQHSASHLAEFIQDTINPPVIVLDESSFESRVLNKDDEEIWLVDFYAPWCGPCQQLSPEWRRLAKMMKDKKTVLVGQVDCDANSYLCNSQNIRSYPTIRLYPIGSARSGTHYMYNGWRRDASSIQSWLFNYLPSKVEVLTSRNFRQKVLDSQEPWIVDFYAPWCGHCQIFKPEFEKVAEQIEGIARAGKVNCDEEGDICQQASVRAYPSVRFYQGVAANHRQSAYGWEVDSQNADYIVRYIKNNVPDKQQWLSSLLPFIRTSPGSSPLFN